MAALIHSPDPLIHNPDTRKESATNRWWAKPMNQERKVDIRASGNGVLSARTRPVPTRGAVRGEHATERRACQNTHRTASDRSLALAFLLGKPVVRSPPPWKNARSVSLALSGPIVGISGIGGGHRTSSRAFFLSEQKYRLKAASNSAVI